MTTANDGVLRKVGGKKTVHYLGHMMRKSGDSLEVDIVTGRVVEEADEDLHDDG